MNIPFNVEIKPMGFPNFVQVSPGGFGEGNPPMMSVAIMNDSQAGAYWDAMRPLWLSHVQQRRALITKPTPRGIE